VNEALLNATVSNAAESAASALYGAVGKSVGAILASNKVSSAAHAFIEFTGVQDTVDVAGSLTIHAEDTAGIYANSKVLSSSVTSNDGGAAVLQETVNDFVPADYASSEGSRSIEFGQAVRLADDYDSELGQPGGVYRYLGTAATLDLSATDYTDLGYWKPVLGTQSIPQGNNISDSDALGLGGLVVLNDVRSQVLAYIDNADVTVASGDVTLAAIENATIDATADSTAIASGGSAYGTGSVVAVNGTIATNVVLSKANAYVVDSVLTVRDAVAGMRTRWGTCGWTPKTPRTSRRWCRTRPSRATRRWV
jgi:hypothetical protein